MLKKYIIVGVVVLVVVGFASWYVSMRRTAPPVEPLSQEAVPQAVVPIEQKQPATPPAATQNNNPKNMQHTITIQTNMGEIQFTTYDADAPKTVENFITLANKGFYNNLTFHRVIPGFMIQGGDPTGNGTGGPGYTFADELNPNTDSFKAGYKTGVVAMANAGPDTNGSQFFIMVADAGLPNAYTIFGKVVKGQDVANAISKASRDPNDKPLTPVLMQKVTVSENK